MKAQRVVEAFQQYPVVGWWLIASIVFCAGIWLYETFSNDDE